MSDYTPISCDLYDKLESMATLHRTGTMTYKGESGDIQEATDEIVDIYAKDGADYCKLSQGTVIRLDQLTAVSVGDEKIL